MAIQTLGSALRQIARLFAGGTVTGLSDAELLERFSAHRDAAAFVALMARHGPMVLSVCRGILDDPNDVEDAFQATFLILLRKAGSFRGHAALSGWLYLVAHRVATRANTASARRRHHERQAAQMTAASSTPRPAAPDERLRALHEEIARLPERLRLAIILCDLRGVPQGQAAAELRLSERTLRRRLSGGRERLKARLSRRELAQGGLSWEALLLREARVSVPPTWGDATIRAALAALSNSLTAGTVSSATLELTREVLKAMLVHKLKLVSAALLGTGLVAWAATTVLTARGEQPPAAAAAPRVAASPPGDIPLGDLGKAAFHGRVVGPDGRPVAGARVWGNTQGGKLLAEAHCDAEGYFRLGPVAPLYRHQFDLYVDADGFARHHVPGGTYSLFPGIDGDLETVRLAQGRVFTGRVLDVDGEPYSNATVECLVQRHILGHTVQRIGPGHRLTTDAEGRFRTPPLEVGILQVTVQVPERQVAAIIRPIAPGGEEVLEPIRLERDVPILGVVKDEEGKPVAGVELEANGPCKAVSDVEGRFTLRGFGPEPRIQMYAAKDGRIFTKLLVRRTDKGLEWVVVDEKRRGGPSAELLVTMEPVAWIEGEAVDADSGEPVKLDNAVLCFVQRMPDGSVRIGGCRDGFKQPSPGHFRVAYSVPSEYQLTLIAAGYSNAEVFTPRVTERKAIRGLTVRMKRTVETKASNAATPKVALQTITGKVTRDGRPVRSGWVGLWGPIVSMNVINAPIQRGRTVELNAPVYASAAIRDGAYELFVPHPDKEWYVAVEEPGQPPTRVGPVAIAAGERKPLDIACVAGGSIGGRVRDVPVAWRDQLWVVAFNRAGYRLEARVGPDGVFSLRQLPPGEYGLKVGHDAYEDTEIPHGLPVRIPIEERRKKSDPWKRAKVVTVEAGQETAGVELEMPK